MSFRDLLDLDSWYEIWATVERNKLRTLLTVSSVFWGMFMLILLLGIGTGFERGVTRNLGGMAFRSVYVWPLRTTMPFAGFRPARLIKFTNRDIGLLRQVDGVDHVAPRGHLSNQVVRRGTRSGKFAVMGETADLPLVEPITIGRGRFISQRDASEHRKVVVLGTEVRRQLFAEGEAVLGEYVQVMGVHFRVVGELTTLKAGEAAQKMSTSVFIPFATFQAVFNQSNSVSLFTIGARPGVTASVVESAARSALGSAHAVHPRDTQALGSANAAETFEKIQGLFRGIRAFVWLIAGVTLVTGMLGVSNILAIAVKQRTREIGVRRALGATAGSIVMMVVKEAMILTTLAGYAGLIAGVASLEALGGFLASIPDAPVVRPEVPLTTVLVGQAILVAAGLGVALVPARHAAHVNPIEALRAE